MFDRKVFIFSFNSLFKAQKSVDIKRSKKFAKRTNLFNEKPNLNEFVAWEKETHVNFKIPFNLSVHTITDLSEEPEAKRFPVVVNTK